jgi:transcriptional regulator with XRE-family HTH domain
VTRRAPTARHRRLIQELRRLREERGLRQEDVARELDWSLSKQEKIERGAIALRVPDVRAMLHLFELATPQHRSEYDALIRLARDARVKGWWHDYADAIPPWFEAYVGLEAEASTLHTYQGHFIPGLLQTEDYARAVYQAVRPTLDADDIERAVAARMKRQTRLSARDFLQLWVVLDEAVLLRQVGGPAIMRAQLEHLAAAGSRPNVTVQVLPFTVGAHASMGTSFVILQFREPAAPDIVYLEDLTSSAYLEEDPHLFRYNVVFDHLRSAALPDDGSAALIRSVARTF